jgi:hypothetical protein
MPITVLFLNSQVRIYAAPSTPPGLTMVASSLHEALALPPSAVQNQIHELAKTLPPPRKQNIACDACRYAHLLCTISLFTAHHLVAHAHTVLTGREKSNVTSSLDSKRYRPLVTPLLLIRSHSRFVCAVFPVSGMLPRI